jgi:hypothetical protein
MLDTMVGSATHSFIHAIKKFLSEFYVPGIMEDTGAPADSTADEEFCHHVGKIK